MTDIISDLGELAMLFPPGSLNRESSQWSSPCPFCDPKRYPGEITNFNGVRFIGADRLFWKFSEDHPRLICRRCGVHRAEDVAALFGMRVTDRLKVSGAYRPVETVLDWLWNDMQLGIYRGRVQRDYWKAFGWSDEIIDRFNLSYGDIGHFSDRHIIPMKIRRVVESQRKERVGKIVDQYYLAGRISDKTPEDQRERKVVHSKGSVKPYLWIVDDIIPTAPILAVTEGEKDGISAAQLGYNFTASFGVHHWGNNDDGKDKFSFLRTFDRGAGRPSFEVVYILGDNDDEGREFNFNLANQAAAMGFQAFYLAWPPDTQEKDLTDYLAAYGIEATNHFLEEHLVTPFLNRLTHRRAKSLSDLVSPNIESAVVSLDELRGNGESSIAHHIEDFLDSYTELRSDFPRGLIKLIGAGPGAGKTHILIQTVEERAEEFRAQRQTVLKGMRDEYANLVKVLAGEVPMEARDDLERRRDTLEQHIQEFSLASVAWFAQYKDNWINLSATGANTHRWFNYLPRDKDNCENHEMVTRLGENHHDIRHFCETVCRFRDTCRKSGYLSQDVQMKNSDIVFFRHEHLFGDFPKDFDLLVVDESPLHVFENHYLEIGPRDLDPFDSNWRDDLSSDVQAIAHEVITLISSLRQLLVEYDKNFPQEDANYILTGNRIIAALDAMVQRETKNARTLADLVDEIVETKKTVFRDDYHPNYKDNSGVVPLRCMPQLFQVLVEELTDLRPVDGNRPSRLTLQGGKLRIYGATPIHIQRRVPIIIADATASMPSIYEAMFNKRRVLEYSPIVRSDKARTMVLQGSDFVRTYLDQERMELESVLTQRKVKNITNIYGDIEDVFSDITLGDEVNPRQILQIIQVIDILANRHKSLLVITYKQVRTLLENMTNSGMILFDVKNKIKWGHYGAMRGTNEFQNVEAVITVGVHRIPYDELFRRILMWEYHLGVSEPLNRQLVHQKKAYHTQTIGYEYPSFADAFADAYVCMVEEGEIIQCAERIRPHVSDDDRYIYILANRPALRFVDEVIFKNDFIQNSKNETVLRVRQYVNSYYRDRKTLPTYAEVTKHCRVSTTVVSGIIKPIREALIAGTYAP